MENINTIMNELAKYLRMQDELTGIIDGLKDDIKAYMTENGVDVLNGIEHKASYKNVISSRLDTVALKKAVPEVAAQFTRETSSKRFIFN